MVYIVGKKLDRKFLPKFVDAISHVIETAFF